MEYANQNRSPYPETTYLNEAARLAENVLESLNCPTNDKLVYKALCRFQDKLDDIVNRITIMETSPFSAEKALNLTSLHRKVDGELTAYECDIHPVRREKVRQWLSDWLASITPTQGIAAE